ncbi:trypsin domain-containing protein [Phthorimaea operculella]|nr:trypsin domain-containing protein [Phthorimaea operculella]
MIVAYAFLVLNLGAVLAVSSKIVGGSLTFISEYPYAASLLYSNDQITYSQQCGGTLLSTKAVLSAAHCFRSDAVWQWRVRVGSSRASSGGTIYTLSEIRIHDDFNLSTRDNDIALLISTTAISFIIGVVQPATVAGPNYILADNEPPGGATSQLRHVRILTLDLETCKETYKKLGLTVSDNMICSGWHNYDRCQGNSGDPLIHNDVIVGISSWGVQCALAEYPGVSTRVSKFADWIASNV